MATETDDLYSDGGGSSQSMESDVDTEETDAVEDSETENSKVDRSTALVPKTFFPGSKELKPGSVCTIEVERVLDGQVLVKYKTENKPNPDSITEPESESEIEEMMA